MRVRELIEELKKLEDQEQDIYVEDSDGIEPVTRLTSEQVMIRTGNGKFLPAIRPCVSWR